MPLIDKSASFTALETRTAILKAVQSWGETESPLKGGFILQNGKFLDMSLGRSNRVLDHQDIIQCFAYPNNIPLDDVLKPLSIMAVKRIGIIRWVGEGRTLSMHRKPTKAQLDTMLELVDFEPTRPLLLDTKSGNLSRRDIEYPPGIDWDTVHEDITRYYGNVDDSVPDRITLEYKVMS